jgi:hypothetical protein
MEDVKREQSTISETLITITRQLSLMAGEKSREEEGFRRNPKRALAKTA